ncbi:hypothetical protein ACTXNW_08635 [Enterococcus malodoratus]|uniref:hypothetical protein n=1 Tax=Enterococcus malodoratus TaxID=71451 RepID=UPI003FD069EE
MVPKFRAWYTPFGGSVKQFNKMKHGSAGSLLTHAEMSPDDYKIMQSTGLKGYMDDSYDDSEEKDVFKGDIIDIFWEEWPMGYYQENHMVGVVDLDETDTAWIIRNAKYDFDTPETIPSEIDGISVSMSLPDDEDLEEIFLHHFNLTSSDITILGNIYENPELLEVE